MVKDPLTTLVQSVVILLCMWGLILFGMQIERRSACPPAQVLR